MQHPSTKSRKYLKPALNFIPTAPDSDGTENLDLPMIFHTITRKNKQENDVSRSIIDFLCKIEDDALEWDRIVTMFAIDA